MSNINSQSLPLNPLTLVSAVFHVSSPLPFSTYRSFYTHRMYFSSKQVNTHFIFTNQLLSVLIKTKTTLIGSHVSTSLSLNIASLQLVFCQINFSSQFPTSIKKCIPHCQFLLLLIFILSYKGFSLSPPHVNDHYPLP